METYISRQPIFDEREQVYAYELLYRSSEQNHYDSTDADLATYDVISKTLISFDFHELSQGHPCFINFTENLLMSSIFNQLSEKNVVVEILEDIPITDRVVKRVQELKQRGYRIALDDFLLLEELKESPIFKYVDIIKVDFMLANEEERLKIDRLVNTDYPHIALLGEKIETMEQYRWAKLHGYKLFQGYFFKEPQVMTTEDIPMNVLEYYRLIALLRDPNTSLDEIATIIERDLSLTYKLLKLINSTRQKQRPKVRSIKAAILSFGIVNLQQWLYILTYREMTDIKTSGRIEEVMKESIIRAKLCESLAKKKEQKHYSEYFLVGMFSLIDVILNRSIVQIMNQLPLPEEVIATLTGGESEMQVYLQLAIAVEQMDMPQIHMYCEQLSLQIEDVMAMYYHASNWAK